MFNLLVGIDLSYTFKTITSRWYYYVFLLVFLIVLVCFLFFKKQPKRNNLSATQKICYASILTAICVVANVFDIKISDVFQISLLALVGFVSGYLLGGGFGFAVCFMGDLIGAILNPHGPYNPIIGIGSGLWGLIFGLAFSSFKGNEYVKILVGFILGFVLVSCGVNTFGFCLMYPTMYTLEILLPLVPLKLAVCAINCVLAIGLYKVLQRILPRDKFNIYQGDK